MTSAEFQITVEKRNELLTLFPNLGKNSDVGKYAIEIAKLFFLIRDSKATFAVCKGGDLGVTVNGKYEEFEIKGTVDADICYYKLKVSSLACYNALLNGMTLIRITNIGELRMTIHFMKHKEDFILVPEPRWAVLKVNNGVTQNSE
jgi:hypothetical protein